MFNFACVTFSVELHYVYRKYDMYVCVCNGNLNFEGFLLRLKNKLTILRTIAAKNNNLKKFMETWAPVLKTTRKCVLLSVFMLFKLFCSSLESNNLLFFFVHLL